jgi:dGTPase
VQGFLINCATFGFTKNYDAIMEGTYGKDIFSGTYAEGLMHLLGDMAYRRVFTTPAIYKMEVAESVILNFLMDKFVHAVLYYDTEVKMGEIEKRLVSFISENYKSAYHKQAEGKDEAEKLYLRLLLVTDYICGMTDSYAKRLYQELKAIV